MTSMTDIFCLYGRNWGLAASPTTRTCSLYGPTKLVTTTLTTGSRTSADKAFSTSCAICLADLPCTTMSDTSGDEILPSGRTGTVIDSSGLRHTEMLSVSPGPTR